MSEVKYESCVLIILYNGLSNLKLASNVLTVGTQKLKNYNAQSE